MTTPLHSTLKRALTIDGREYVVTLTQAALKLTLKGKRNGVELSWAELVNGEAALAVALHASLGAFTGKNKGGGGAEQRPEAPRSETRPTATRVVKAKSPPKVRARSATPKRAGAKRTTRPGR